MKVSSSNPDSVPQRIDLQLRTETAKRRQYWRNIEEFSRDPELGRTMPGEFLPGASEWPPQLDRRRFLNLMAASCALAGMTGCTRQPLEEIVPYVSQPEEITLGKALYFATAMPLGGFGTGILVKSREGRPIKADGNPQHPASLGGSSVWIQASLLDLYNPDRAKTVTQFGRESSWPVFLGEFYRSLEVQGKKDGAGLRILTETITSPTLTAQIQSILKKYPESRWHQYEPISRDNVLRGSQIAFGAVVATHFDFRKAKVILSLDADFLQAHPERLRYARHFTDARRIAESGAEMNRLYVCETSPSVTGAMADHRMPMSSWEIEAAARQITSELGVRTEGPAAQLSQAQRHWVTVVTRDLKEHRGECLVMVGESQSPMLHALGHAINETLGNVGRTVGYSASAESVPVIQVESLRELAAAMEANRVELLVAIGGNPVFDAPADFDFAKRLERVKQAVHLSATHNETSRLCKWHIPRTHFLESWSDIRSFDGTATIMQPLIAPLFDGHSDHELLAAMQNIQSQGSTYEILREFWREQNVWPDFEKGWRKAVHDGVIEGTRLPDRSPKLRPVALEFLWTAAAAMEVAFRPDPNVWDGRFADNPWLQEVPKPISKLTWDNAVIVSAELARREKLSTGDVVELRTGERSVRGPVLVSPGQAENTVTLPLGYGRKETGSVGRDVGFDFFPLRTSDAFWAANAVSIKKTGERHELVSTQEHQRLDHEERQIYRAGTLKEFRANPQFLEKRVKRPRREETLYDPEQFEDGRKWGMSIDLGTCIGCNACLMACNIENNIPVVGKRQVAMNREMLWLRIDTYFKGPLENPQIYFQPVPCMHCENAPCEYVCPVEASIHDHEGLNLQIYNRCIGTRYCSNNCPYKVRRFNFFHYAKVGSLEALRQNPEVTVRSRGVMEKCTYCVQRISAARIEAEKENRPIRDGEVRTACQEACPANAIAFGVMTDRESAVAKLKEHPLDFSMLGQLNTRPRTTYLAKLTNPNPSLEERTMAGAPG